MSLKKVFFWVLIFVMSVWILFKIGSYLFYIEMTSTFPLLQEDCYELNLVDFEQRIQSQEGWEIKKTMLTGKGDNTFQQAELSYHNMSEKVMYGIKYKQINDNQKNERVSLGVIVVYSGEMGIGGAQKSDSLVSEMMIFLNEELLHIFNDDRCQ